MFHVSLRKIISLVILASLLLQSCTPIGLVLVEPVFAMNAENSVVENKPTEYLPLQFEHPQPRYADQNVADSQDQISPLLFIENVGEFDAKEHFQVQANNSIIHFAKDAIWITLVDTDYSFKNNERSTNSNAGGTHIKLSFDNSNADPIIEGYDPLDTHVSFFRGDNPDQWYSDVPAWRGIRYKEIYPGIDLEITSESGIWSWQFVINDDSLTKVTGKPIEATNLKMKVEGANGIAIENNHLRIHTNTKDVAIPSPTLNIKPSNQRASGKKFTPLLSVSENNVVVPLLDPDASTPAQTELLETIQESALLSTNGLIASTVLNGDVGQDVDMDSAGSIYVTGRTYSGTFPTTPGSFQPTAAGNFDITVAKLNPSMSSLVYATYIGGSQSDMSHGIVVGLDGSVYVTGTSSSTNYPTTSGAYDRTVSGSDAVVTKLNTNGTRLVFSTYFGGTGAEEGYDIALDSANNPYITGHTSSSGLPTTSGVFDSTFNGGSWDVFVAKLNSSGSGLIYSTFIGGSVNECDINGLVRACSISVDSTGAAIVGGVTDSSNFPTTTGAYDRVYGGGRDPFVLKLNATGSALVYSTYLGGSGAECVEWGCIMEMGSDGSTYITGSLNNGPNGGADIFIIKVNSSGTGQIYSRIIGGNANDAPSDLVINGVGDAYITGYTHSTNFPVSADAFDSILGGVRDAFIIELKGSTLSYASFLGGDGDEIGYGISLGSNNSLLLAGWTTSANFPTTPGAYDSIPSGGDSYVTNLRTTYPPISNNSTLNAASGMDGGFACMGCTQGYRGGPINTRTGTYDYSVTDISIVTEAGPLTFERTYSSAAISLYSTNLGYGWTHNHDLYLVIGSYVDNKRTITLKGHTANQYSFTQQSGSTNTIAEPGVFATLVQGPSSFILTSKSQEKYEFNLTTGKLTKYQNPNGQSLLYTYDNKGKLQKIADQSGQRYLVLSYSGSTIVSVADHTGRAVIYHYLNGDLDYAKDVLQQTWTYEYLNHRMTRVAAPGNVTVERTEYDSQGRAWKQFGPDADGDGQDDLIVELTYNADGTTTVADAIGTSETHIYDNRKTLVESDNAYQAGEQNQYDANFRPAVNVDALEHPTYLTWSGDGANLTKVVDALQHEISITYGTLNNPTSIVDAMRYETKYFYNDPNFPAQPTRIEYPLSFNNGVTYIGTDYEYYPPSSGAYAGKVKFETDARLNRTYYTYTAFGQLASVTTAYGTTNALTTSYVYDTLGRLTDTTVASVTTHNEYNLAGQLTKTTRNYNTSYSQNYQNIYNLVTEYRYDTRGNQIAVIDTYGVITRTYYDLADRPVTVVQNLAGQTIETPTPPARGSGAIDENMRTDTVYADNGTIIATIDADYVTTRTYYDLANRPVTIVQNFIGDLNAPVPPQYNPAYPDQNIRTDTVYDVNDNVIASIDTDGVITRTYYDQLNRPEVVVQNLYINGTLDDINQPLSQVPAYNSAYPDRNLRTTTKYDANGNVIATTDPKQIVTRTYYDALNRPKTVVQAFTGDINATEPPERISGATSSNIRTDTFYDEAGNVIATVDPRGFVTRTYYDEANRPVTIVQNLTVGINDPIPGRFTGNPDQNIRTDTVYDQNGRRASTIDPFNRETRYGYDALGQLIKVTVNYVDGQPENDQNKFNIVSEYTYDALGRTLTTTDPLDRVTRNIYDDLGRFTSNTVNYLPGQAQNYEDAAGDRYNIVTAYTYDRQGNQIAITDTTNVVTRTYFDRLGRPITVVRSLNQSITNPTPPERGNPSDSFNIRTDTIYRGNGTVDRVIDEMGKTTSFDYDDLGRQTLILDPLLNPTINQYNAVGELSLIRDGNLVETTFEYDALGRLSEVTENFKLNIQPDHETNVETKYTYDANGNRLTILDGNNHLTSFTYDEMNRLQTEKDALDHETVYGYDVGGNRVSLLDANGKTTAFVYDELNRLEQIDYPDPDADITFTYDAVGRRKSMSGSPNPTNWDYDNLNRPTSITDPFSTVVSYDYDSAGNRSLLSYNGITVNYQYDNLGRMISVSGGMGGTVGYGYDSTSRLKTVTRPNGVNTTYQYYDNGWLQSLMHTSAAETLSSYQYQYDGVGNRTQAIEGVLLPEGLGLNQAILPTDTPSDTPTPSGTISPTLSPTVTDTPAVLPENFTPTVPDTATAVSTPSPIDTPTSTPAVGETFMPTETLVTGASNNHTNMFFVDYRMEPISPTSLGIPYFTVPLVQTTTTIDYIYDPLNRLTEANYATGDYYHYSYDEVGNRVGQETLIGGLPATTSYLYDNANRLTSVNGVTYTWDNNGNLLNDGVNTYTYTSNKLSSISGENLNVTFQYRCNGESIGQFGCESDRVSQTVNGVTTDYVLDIASPLTQVLQDGTNTYLYGIDRIAQISGATPEYFLTDGLGSVRQLVDSTGAVTLAKSYQPYGTEASSVGSGLSSYGFTGEMTDTTGLIYLRARYLAPNDGRFLTKDSWIGDYNRPLSLNRWVYGYGNPVNHTDPSGHLPCTSTYYSPDCTYIPVQPTIVSRQAWGAHAPGSYGIQNNPVISEGLFSAENPEGYMTYSGNLSAIYNKITIHHEGDDQTYNVLAVQEAEMNSGFYDIGYHFIVGQDGTIYEGRNINVRGNHAYPNTGNIGILWLGDFVPGYDISDPLGRYGQIDPQDDVHGPALPQYFSTIALISWLNYKYGIDNLYGHRELNITACPGDYAMPYVNFLKDFER